MLSLGFTELMPQAEELNYLGVLFTSVRKMDCEMDGEISAVPALMQAL